MPKSPSSRPEFRRRGVAECSYPQACRVFLQRFDLQRIRFKPPAQNVGAIRVKEKLGIRFIGEETDRPSRQDSPSGHE